MLLFCPIRLTGLEDFRQSLGKSDWKTQESGKEGKAIEPNLVHQVPEEIYFYGEKYL